MAVQTLLAARVFDGAGAAPIEEASCGSKRALIRAIGRRADLGSATAGARDLGDATILPGLINMHTHLTCSAAWTCSATHSTTPTKSR